MLIHLIKVDQDEIPPWKIRSIIKDIRIHDESFDDKISIEKK